VNDKNTISEYEIDSASMDCSFLGQKNRRTVGENL